MSDLEAVLADVSYLMAMEKSKNIATKAPKKNIIPDSSIRSIMVSYLSRHGKITFENIFQERLGFIFFVKFCKSQDSPNVQLIEFYEAIKDFELIDSECDRVREAKRIYDTYIMKELLSKVHRFPSEHVRSVQSKLNEGMKFNSVSRQIFSVYIDDLKQNIKNVFYEPFLKSKHFTLYLQWMDVQLNTTLTMSDFSVHRIIGRGGFGEVYGCRKLDSGKMYAMKCLDKKRIKLKSGESMALNERTILSRVSSGDASPFIVCMTYAFQTPEKLCFILDLMNGGDLNYHLSQRGTFNEEDVKFYVAEIILGLQHMHERNIVYRDLKPANILLDESGHVRISDLGLACDVSESWPTAAVGTQGYMAPEVLQKGVPYAFSADWYSLGCTVYKLLVGSSPFRQHSSKRRYCEAPIGRQKVLQIPDSFEDSTKAFLIGLLQTNIEVRLGCQGQGSEELMTHSFLSNMDWEMAKRQRLQPPLIPPQGEVNAADAFEIGAFDEEDTQGIRLTEEDQQVYKEFDVVIADRWQHEMTTTIFDAVNEDFDQMESKRRAKLQQRLNQLTQTLTSQPEGETTSTLTATPSALPQSPLSRSASSTVMATSQQKSLDHEDIPSWPAELLLEWWIDPERYGCGPSDCLVESELLRLGGPFLHTWQKKHVRLFPNRLEIYTKNQHGIPLKGAEFISMLDIASIYPTLQHVNKYDGVIIVVLKSQSKIFLTSQDQIVVDQWLNVLLQAFEDSSQVLSSMSRKVYWIYGIDEPKLYARASPSCSNSTQLPPPPPPPLGVTQPDLATKRKQFRRMQSFQTALTSRNWSPPPPAPPPPPPPAPISSASSASQPPAVAETTSARRVILKNLNKMGFSRSQDISSPLLPPRPPSPLLECTKSSPAAGNSGGGHHKQA